MAEKLVGVPGSILLCFAFKDPRVRLRIVQLLDSVLVPKCVQGAGLLCRGAVLLRCAAAVCFVLCCAGYVPK